MENQEQVMTYNSERKDLIIPEYGRSVHNMVNFALSIADREERNKVAKAIISVMGQLFPYLRDIEDFNHKLWDHLHIMANFELEVDSPYPKPEAETFLAKPDPIAYPSGRIRFGHYGKIVQEMISKASGMEDGEEKTAFTASIANLMKRHYVMYNSSSVEDAVIFQQITELSNGELKAPENLELISAQEIIKTFGKVTSSASIIKKKITKKKPMKRR
ncbi:MAG: hypothetical protein ACI898_000559 [Flavobacteriales bacterium]|jgi:hypothetical protein